MEDVKILGPFVGHTSQDSVRFWIYCEDFQSLHFKIMNDQGQALVQEMTIAPDGLPVGIVDFSKLQADTTYAYQVFIDKDCTTKLDLAGIKDEWLKFQTLPKAETVADFDFLLLSCHNPAAGLNKKIPNADGFEVWSALPAILNENPNVRFAILGGDQVYLDEAAEIAENCTDLERTREILKAYKSHWYHEDYRRVLCSLPSYLMWDDHDIVDGWGSEEKHFKAPDSLEFRPEWIKWFESARHFFWTMQANRNPDVFQQPPTGPYDTCFRVGSNGFVLLDLRSNRNAHAKQIWSSDQFERIKNWVGEQNQLETLFVVSPVVFSHGDPKTEGIIDRIWPWVLKQINKLRKYSQLNFFVRTYDKTIGDLRDDLKDAWFSPCNEASAEAMLDYLFGLQNPAASKTGIDVIILSGDIHTSGYSTIHSEESIHKNAPTIPQIVSSPVSYSAFHWALEAYYRSKTKTLRLAPQSKYKAQISHHFSDRCATVLSLRTLGGKRQLKVKFYREGFDEPTNVIFDLEKNSHLEKIRWKASTIQAASKSSASHESADQPKSPSP